VAGKTDVTGAVQVAQLALKHRRNKNGGQRVVVFVGSPIDADAKALVKVCGCGWGRHVDAGREESKASREMVVVNN
jgi:hypothetical protein